MKKQVIIIAILLFSSFYSISQRRIEGNTISVATSLNFYPQTATYKFATSSISYQTDGLLLNFITNNEGTFEILEGEEIKIDRTHSIKLPSQIIGAGTGVRIMNPDFFYQEFALSKISISKSNEISEVTFNKANAESYTTLHGYEQYQAVFALRYELGKYFNRRRKAPVKFGLGGGIEPSYHYISIDSYSLDRIPINAKVFTVDLSVIPMLSFRFSNSVFMDFKIVTNFLIAEFGSVTQKDPSLNATQQIGEREIDLPELNMGLGLQIRYIIKEPKRR